MTNAASALQPAIDVLEQDYAELERKANGLLTSINVLRERAGLPRVREDGRRAATTPRATTCQGDNPGLSRRSRRRILYLFASPLELAGNRGILPIYRAKTRRGDRPREALLPLDIFYGTCRLVQVRGAARRDGERVVMLPIDADIVEAFMETGQGWIERVEAALRSAIARKKD